MSRVKLADEFLKDEDVHEDTDHPAQPGPQEIADAVFRAWKNAKTLKQRMQVVLHLTTQSVAELAKVLDKLPPDFVQDIQNYAKKEVANYAHRTLRLAPKQKVLTLNRPQAIKLLVSRGVDADALIESGSNLDLLMPGGDMMFMLDFKNHSAQFGSMDENGHFDPHKKFKLTDAFLYDLATAWVKRNE